MLKAILLFPVQLVWQWLKSPVIATRKAWIKTIGAAKKSAVEKDRAVWLRGRNSHCDKPVFVGPDGANFKRRRRGHRGGKKHHRHHDHK